VLLCGAGAGAALADGVVARRIHDPVFHGQAQLYLAGPETAPAVLLVHGIGEKGARDWDGLIPRLARDFRVVAFDLPGFGRSSKDNAPYTPDNYVAFLRHLVQEQVRRGPLTLVGHSMGAALALRYAARYPQDVASLVLADVPGILHRLAYSQYLSHLGLNLLPSLYPVQNDHLHNLATNFLGWIEKAKPAPEAIVAKPALRKSLLNADPARIAGLALAIEDFSQDIANVRASTLLLWGGRDELAPLRNARVLRANLPNAQLEVFETSGHTPMDDVPEAFNARVAEFVRAPVITQPNGMARYDGAPPETARVGRCQRQRGVVFEGDYDRIEIERCRDVVIRNARARMVRITNAAAAIEDSMVGGTPNGGLIVDDARVLVTSTVIDADIAIRLDDARLDIAGSRIRGRRQAVAATRKSEIVFSVSRADSPHFHGGLHGLRVVTPDRPL
jgi:pimeloyl-ACP methyl ester carboxylesterase